MPAPEQHARETIDRLLTQAGWRVCDAGAAIITAHRGVALREFPLRPGHGEADYLLYVDGNAAGVIEAKKEGVTLTGVETQAAKYTQGLPDGLSAWRKPLPFAYQSTGIETRFTNGLDPLPRSRPVFDFHKPETLGALLDVAWAARLDTRDIVAEATPIYKPTLPQGERGRIMRAAGGPMAARISLPATRPASISYGSRTNPCLKPTTCPTQT